MPKIEISEKEIKNRNYTRIYLIVTSVLFGILIFPSLPMIMMSPMMFDSPGSENSIPTIILVISIIAYPILTVIGIALGWFLFTKRKNLIAVLFASLPILNIIIGIATILYMAIACNGNFDC
ncbi:hypothetical protein [Aquimarina sp. 2201CG5-10]|uniref:hypothetical protein n=1 Tax=Aquimarina callyspongiae TaxID=3098150 RepID=UPI002AB40C00|nr:hypothetical protein [Aquimarina sp. 2201CG5-10]MDY8134117.1 hypothetical protein [Aquimarina sp. 2201CG5-10]